MKLQALGIDLGKTVFHLVGLDSTGRVVVRKRCSRTQLLAFTANLQVQLIGMEACSGAHFLGRALREQGHEVRLMPAQYVKPYVQTNKSPPRKCRSGASKRLAGMYGSSGMRSRPTMRPSSPGGYSLRVSGSGILRSANRT
jgi:transposase